MKQNGGCLGSKLKGKKKEDSILNTQIDGKEKELKVTELRVELGVQFKFKE